ncbi:rhodanese-like domain-containing protein [Tropicimonas sp. S265A]|uniref:rhodanese-like domain-containing protein n=1 Tax=Tropicimonas sp. S265A TaxID=3415134 RepID=UPI003C7E83CD
MALISRRAILAGVGIAAAGAVAYTAVRAPGSDRTLMTPPEALEAARRGDILLVDIRRPDEWEETGLAEGAIPIDMRREDFADALAHARAASNRPVALICARGVRSRRLTAVLTDADIGPIIDIPEGMLGSLAGPGWLKRNLPVQPWTGET